VKKSDIHKDLKDLKLSIWRGTGEAFLILKKYRNRRIPESFKKEILYASFHNLGYDQQMEMGRNEYMYELILMTYNPGFFLEMLAKSFHKSQEIEDWDRCLAFEILKCFLKNGENSISQLLRQIYASNINSGYGHIIGMDLMEAEGMDAFLFIADYNGKELLKQNGFYQSDDLLNYAKEIIVNTDLESLLIEKSKTDVNIKAYLNAVVAHREKMKRIVRSKRKKWKREKPLIGKRYREKALELLNNAKEFDRISEGLHLLKHNFQKDDVQLIKKILELNFNDIDEEHLILRTIVEALEGSMERGYVEFFEQIYLRLNCGSCRCHLVKLLIKNNLIPKWMFAEIKYDSAEEIRKAAGEYILKKEKMNTQIRNFPQIKEIAASR